jgi:hypothetical protein
MVVVAVVPLATLAQGAMAAFIVVATALRGLEVLVAVVGLVAFTQTLPPPATTKLMIVLAAVASASLGKALAGLGGVAASLLLVAVEGLEGPLELTALHRLALVEHMAVVVAVDSEFLKAAWLLRVTAATVVSAQSVFCGAALAAIPVTPQTFNL